MLKINSVFMGITMLSTMGHGAQQFEEWTHQVHSNLPPTRLKDQVPHPIGLASKKPLSGKNRPGQERHFDVMVMAVREDEATGTRTMIDYKVQGWRKVLTYKHPAKSDYKGYLHLPATYGELRAEDNGNTLNLNCKNSDNEDVVLRLSFSTGQKATWIDKLKIAMEAEVTGEPVMRKRANADAWVKLSSEHEELTKLAGVEFGGVSRNGTKESDSQMQRALGDNTYFCHLCGKQGEYVVPNFFDTDDCQEQKFVMDAKYDNINEKYLVHSKCNSVWYAYKASLAEAGISSKLGRRLLAAEHRSFA